MSLALPEETPLNLQDGSRWTLRDSVTLNAQLKSGGTGYDPIPEWYCTKSFTSPILRIQAVSTDTSSRKLMGRLIQDQEIPLNSGSLVSLSARRIWRGSQIVRFAQDIENSYKIRILPRYYVHNISFLIYEFV